MAYRFFHRTTDDAAASILSGGFRNARGFYMFTGLDEPLEGVWISDVPLDAGSGAKGTALLEVILDVPDAVLAEHEIIESQKPYREWLVPADFLNSIAKIRLVVVEEEDALFGIDPVHVVSVFVGESGRRYGVYRHDDGPVVHPHHVPGKWYWNPWGFLVDEDINDEDPSYALPYDTKELAEAAAMAWDRANPPS